MSGDTPAVADRRPASSGGAGAVVRRIVVFVILFALVEVAAFGVIGLIEEVLGTRNVLIAGDSPLARSLAYTVIGVPLVAVLWWWERRRLTTDPGERASLVWSLYVAGMSTTSLVLATIGYGGALTAGIRGEWRPGDAAAGLVWTGVWLWHRWMRRSPRTAPTRLMHLSVELGALWGLAVGAWGAAGAIAALVSVALESGALTVAMTGWWTAILEQVVWLVLGAIIWWWHWFRERARTAPGAFAGVLLVIVIGAAAATTLFQIGTTLWVLLRVLFDQAPVADAIAQLDEAVAAGLVGALVWVYHAGVLAVRSDQVRRAARLVVSGVALIGAASGFGVVINALLATLNATLVDQGTRSLLLGGISALVVGGVTWFIAWRPDRSTPTDAADPGRRVYLVVVFGASAVVAIVTILWIGYQLFEFALGDPRGEGLVERIRAPLGLLAATALVFAYHFAIWRRYRAAAPKADKPRIGRVILVAGADPSAQADRIHEATGAHVSVWRASDPASRIADEELAGLIDALGTVSASRVLVIAGTGAPAQIVPLAE